MAVRCKTYVVSTNIPALRLVDWTRIWLRNSSGIHTHKSSNLTKACRHFSRTAYQPRVWFSHQLSPQLYKYPASHNLLYAGMMWFKYSAAVYGIPHKNSILPPYYPIVSLPPWSCFKTGRQSVRRCRTHPKFSESFRAFSAYSQPLVSLEDCFPARR